MREVRSRNQTKAVSKHQFGLHAHKKEQDCCKGKEVRIGWGCLQWLKGLVMGCVKPFFSGSAVWIQAGWVEPKKVIIISQLIYTLFGMSLVSLQVWKTRVCSQAFPSSRAVTAPVLRALTERPGIKWTLKPDCTHCGQLRSVSALAIQDW